MNEAEAAARAEQRRLAGLVRLGPAISLPAQIGGVDVSYASNSNRAVAAAVVLERETLAVIDSATVVGSSDFPYIPGLLSFRELPLAMAAIEKLSIEPELVVADGHGYAHPARLGLACHLGIELDRPTIGCAKTAFIGEHRNPGLDRGAWAEVTDGGEVIGSVVRTQRGVKPLYVSPGHLIDFQSARLAILALAPNYRLPETTRAADRLSRQVLAATTEVARQPTAGS